MRNLFFIFAIFFYFVSDSFSFGEEITGTDTTYDVTSFFECKNDTVIYRKVNKNVPTFAIYLKVKNTDDYFPVEGIIIKDSATGKTLQKIDVEKDSLAIMNISFDDYNFDGYLDIYFYDGCAILANCFGKVYTYDVKKNIFVHDKVFDEMTSVDIDASKKEIYSFNRCCGGNESDFRIYKYINDRLTIQKQVEKKYDEKSGIYIYTVREFDKFGKARKTKTTRSKDSELDL